MKKTNEHRQLICNRSISSTSASTSTSTLEDSSPLFQPESFLYYSSLQSDKFKDDDDDDDDDDVYPTAPDRFFIIFPYEDGCSLCIDKAKSYLEEDLKQFTEQEQEQEQENGYQASAFPEYSNYQSSVIIPQHNLILETMLGRTLRLFLMFIYFDIFISGVIIIAEEKLSFNPIFFIFGSFLLIDIFGIIATYLRNKNLMRFFSLFVGLSTLALFTSTQFFLVMIFRLFLMIVSNHLSRLLGRIQ